MLLQLWKQGQQPNGERRDLRGYRGQGVICAAAGARRGAGQQLDLACWNSVCVWGGLPVQPSPRLLLTNFPTRRDRRQLDAIRRISGLESANLSRACATQSGVLDRGGCASSPDFPVDPRSGAAWRAGPAQPVVPAVWVIWPSVRIPTPRFWVSVVAVSQCRSSGLWGTLPALPKPMPFPSAGHPSRPEHNHESSHSKQYVDHILLPVCTGLTESG